MGARVAVAWFALVGLFAAQVAAAEPLGSYFTVTPFGGYTIFDGDVRYPRLYPLKDNVYGGGRIGFQLNNWLGIEGAGGFVPTNEDGNGVVASPSTPPTPAQSDVLGDRDIDYWHVSGNIMLSPWSGRYGGPYVFGGGGYARLELKTGSTLGETPLEQGNVEFGGGVRLWFTDQIGLRLEARDILWIPGDSKIEKTQHIVVGGGLTFALTSRPRDSDGDGVPDRKDKCPATTLGARVDGNGCPTDGDGDKVFDGLDQCPNTPQGCVVDAKGCPSDQDGDGVCDGVDQCADTPKGATVDAKGCTSDEDGDGIVDGIDKCPGTVKGCTVDASGCSKDSDGDDVCDGLDRCPGTQAAAKVDKDGCPIEVVERETELLDTGMIRLQNVNFDTGKADLLSESLPQLDVVGQVLTKWPELKVEVGGHTDSRGSEALNQSLSEARAQSVLNYLTQKFPSLQPGQFSAKGYGEAKPVAPNTTPLNMAKNRRVEFVVVNKDVLKRESQRRRLLQKGESAPDTTIKR